MPQPKYKLLFIPITADPRVNPCPIVCKTATPAQRREAKVVYVNGKIDGYRGKFW